jgi:hypothetical protein
MMSRVFNNHELTWRGNDLCIGNSRTPLVSIVQDETWPGMWRVRYGDRLSDMTNVTRARDAARCIALSLLNEMGQQETPLAASPVEKTSESLVTIPDSACELQVVKHARRVEDRTGLAAIGQVEKAKGGRGKRGGISEAARRAGISRYAAMRAAKPVRGGSTRLAPDAPKPVSAQQAVKRPT